jgi:hypothetical protein
VGGGGGEGVGGGRGRELDDQVEEEKLLFFLSIFIVINKAV